MNDIEKQALINGFKEELEKNGGVVRHVIEPIVSAISMAPGKMWRGLKNAATDLSEIPGNITKKKAVTKKIKDAKRVKSKREKLQKRLYKEQQADKSARQEGLEYSKLLKVENAEIQKRFGLGMEVEAPKTNILPWVLTGGALAGGVYAVNKLKTPANLYPSDREKVVMNLNRRYRG